MLNEQKQPFELAGLSVAIGKNWLQRIGANAARRNNFLNEVRCFDVNVQDDR